MLVLMHRLGGRAGLRRARGGVEWVAGVCTGGRWNGFACACQRARALAQEHGRTPRSHLARHGAQWEPPCHVSTVVCGDKQPQRKEHHASHCAS